MNKQSSNPILPNGGARKPSAKTTLGGVDVGTPQIRQGLLCCLGDGILWQIMFTLVETFSVAAALSLKAPALAIALIGSLPMLIGSYAQAFALSRIDPKKTRKQYIVAAVRTQVFFILVALCAGFLPAPLAAWVFVGALALYGLCGRLFENLWITWFSDLVPDAIMGRQTAWRNLFLSITQFSVALLVGWIGRKLTAQTAPWSFFITIFLIAAVARFGSSMFVQAQYEPPRDKPFVPLSFRDFKPSKVILLYAIAMSLFQGAAGMSGPFFGVWFLRDLHFDYLTFTLASAFTTLGGMLTLRVWGKLTDKIGTARVLRLSVFMAAMVPFPYLLWSTPFAVWMFNFYSGIAWTGLGIAGFKYLIQASDDSHPEQTLTFYTCVFATINFLFAMLGGFLATRIPALFGGWQLQTLFCMSGLLRLIFYFCFFFRLPELGKPQQSDMPLVKALLQFFYFWESGSKD